jgi:DnaJ-class molecular chaperone
MLVYPDATAAEVKAAWRTQAAELHPDRFVGMKESVQKAATARFAELSAAYAVLSDQARRKAHDVERMVGFFKCEACSGAGRRAESRGLGPRKKVTCQVCEGSGRLPGESVASRRARKKSAR